MFVNGYKGNEFATLMGVSRKCQNQKKYCFHFACISGKRYAVYH